MGSYVEQCLIKEEVVQYEGEVCIWSLLPLIIIGLLLIPFFGLGLILWIIAAIRYYTTEIAITNKRVIAKFGLIRRDTVEINITKIESVQVDQSILGRLFNFGSIVVAGAGDPKAPIPGISNPMNFRKNFFETQETSIAKVTSVEVEEAAVNV